MIWLMTCAKDEELGELLADAAIRSCREAQQDYRLLAQAENAREARSFLQTSKGAGLLALEADGSAAALDGWIDLALEAQQRCKDTLLLLILHGLDTLASFVNHSTRPSGVLMFPVSAANAEQTFARMLRVYHDTAVPDEQTLVLQFGNTTHRVPMNQIVYLEAQSKKVDIYTRVRCLTVYESLKSIQEQLDDRFVQCHRSYIVNSRRIQSADYTNLLLTLDDGASVPISRASRAAVKASLRQDAEREA